MKCISILLCLSVGLAEASNSIHNLVLPDALITVRVIDESGCPVDGANVGIGFGQGGNAWVGEHKSETIRGLSDTNGLFSAHAKSMGGIGFRVEKEGFYPSVGEYRYPGTYQDKKRWEPWNPINTLVLKKIKTPITMYVKRVRTEVPVIGKQIGFDLQEGDWVDPYGKGSVSDFIFYAELEKRDANDFDYSLNLRFSNEKDGIKPVEAVTLHEASKLKSDHNAPIEGYLSSWRQFRMRRPNVGEKNNIDINRMYYFRVRTKMDNHGNIISALYGKMYGDFLQFTYYLNPTSNDRNVEFDPDKNRFKGNDRFAP